MNLVLFGPPGAGKGTQADNLVKKFELIKISTGELLRNEIEKKSSLGYKIQSLIDKGTFVSDDLINSLIENVIKNKNFSNRLIFDGFPRNIHQVKLLAILIKKYNQEISCALRLKVDMKIVVKRILGRQVCSKCGLTFNKFFNPTSKTKHLCDTSFLKTRSDDNEEVIKRRIKTYNEETLPVLKYYQNENLLHEVDGMGDISTIFNQICRIMHSLET